MPSILRRLMPLVLLLCVATGALSLGFLLANRRPLRPTAKLLEVTVLNVGQGEATLIRTPNGQIILLGAGPPETAEAVAKALTQAGVKQIDLLILPYPYAEAIGGVSEVFAQFPVKMALETGSDGVNEWQQKARQLLRESRVSVRLVRAGDELTMDGVRIEILAPANPLLTAEPVAANNSLVVAVRYGSTRFLWMGGIERAGEVALLSRTPDLRANWLRVSRFGTRLASSPELLRQVSPEYIVVSVGQNRSGLPHVETLKRLNATGATVVRTDVGNAPNLRFLSDGLHVTQEP